MGKDRTIHNTDIPTDETTELAVDLALAVTGQSDGSVVDCPSPEILAALSEGKLSEAERQSVLDHLDQCPRCRDEWLLVASVNEPPMADPAPKVGRTFSVGQLFTGASIGAVVAASLVWFFFLSPMFSGPPAYEVAVNQGYGALLDDGPMYASARHIAEGLAEEGAIRGGESKTAKAFRFGWNNGLTTIDTGSAKQGAEPETEALRYMRAVGRWLVLLSVALQTDPAPDATFWRQQAQTALLFRDENLSFAGAGDKLRIKRGFAALTSTLQALGSKPEQAGLDRLQRQVNGVIHLMRSVNVTGR